MERVVVDANVFVKWFVEEEYTREALLLRGDHMNGCIRIAAPVYALLEVADALRKYVARAVIETSDALEALDALVDFDIEFIHIEEKLARDALKYSLNSHITVYDSYYIATARALNAYFYTADEKLLNRIQAHEKIAHHIKNYKPRCSARSVHTIEFH